MGGQKHLDTLTHRSMNMNKAIRDNLTDTEWDTFFDLMDKAINIGGLTAYEKRDLFREMAEQRQSEMTLDEFCAECEED
jgi:hypothetical protein